MLAERADRATVRYPVYLSGKIDGIRCLGVNGAALSRTLRPIPNRFVQKWFDDNTPHLDGLDGELIVGRPTAPDVYRRTYSGVMRQDGEPDFTYWVFDIWSREDAWLPVFLDTMPKLAARHVPRLSVVTHHAVTDEAHLTRFEDEYVRLGYEGVMLRDPQTLYKQGRSTLEEGILLKLKRFEDAEGVVVGFEELMHNENEATLDARGYTKRSSHKSARVPGDTLGALIVEGLTAFKGQLIWIWTGFSADLRKFIWTNRELVRGAIVKFKYFAVGLKSAPRHGSFIGFRDWEDLNGEFADRRSCIGEPVSA